MAASCDEEFALIMKLVKLHCHPKFGKLGSCRLIGCLGSVPLNDRLFMVMLPQPGPVLQAALVSRSLEGSAGCRTFTFCCDGLDL